MARICVLDKNTNVCVNVLYLADENEWKDHAYFIKASRNDGNVGWTLLSNGEWDTGYVPPTMEELSERAKGRRKKYLEMTDKYMILDYPITEEKRNEWKVYRQALRDITSQPGYPINIDWPIMPTEE